MVRYDAANYGRAVGADYDAMYPGVPAEDEAAVSLLVSLARQISEPSLLEFGIGTGRLALPVRAAGIPVAGIDGSESMISILRGKPGGEGIDVVLGDYRSAGFDDRRFAVAMLVFNGIFDPRGRVAQLDIFRNAARQLLPGGFFVVESWVMSDAQRHGDWSVVPRFVAENHVELQLARYDIDSNQIERTLVHVRPDGVSFVSVTDTYASPNELDLMAEVAGFERSAHYGAWDRSPLTATSSKHIGIYRLRDRTPRG